MLRTLMEKTDNMQEHMGNVSRETEILRQNLKRNAIKIVAEIKNAFDRWVHQQTGH